MSLLILYFNAHTQTSEVEILVTKLKLVTYSFCLKSLWMCNKIIKLQTKKPIFIYFLGNLNYIVSLVYHLSPKCVGLNFLHPKVKLGGAKPFLFVGAE